MSTPSPWDSYEGRPIETGQPHARGRRSVDEPESGMATADVRAKRRWTGPAGLISIAIIIISTALVALLSGRPRPPHPTRVISLIRELKFACSHFRLEHNRFPWTPPNKVGPKTRIDPVNVYAELKGRGKINRNMDYLGDMLSQFVQKGRVVDSWGNPIQFRIDPNDLEPVIWSCGADGKDDTNDGQSPDPKKQPKTYYWFGKRTCGDDIGTR